MTETSTADRSLASQRQAGASFLAEASRLLADSLGYESTLSAVAGLALPYFGAWCIVDLCRAGEMRRAAVIHSDPEMQALVRRLESGWPPERNDPFGVPRAVRTRETEVIAEIPEQTLIEVSRGEENLQILRSLGIGSTLVVPLMARGEVLGAITYVSPQGGRVHGQDDVALAEDLAARCAIALDNARLHQEATESRQFAEDASAAKSQFLAVMSHELRTPLTGVVAYAELLEAGVLGPMQAKQKDACARIQLNCRHLVSIIDQILVFSRAEAGRLEVHPEEVDVVQIAREVVQILVPEAERRGLDLRLERDDATPPLWTDPGKVRQILLNIIGNATKFTTEGEIAVTVDCDRSLREGFQIHVRDTGPGIAPEEQERIFEPFTQAGHSRSRGADGSGLGLAISLKVARLLGGDITLRSTPGQGSIFTLHLPFGDEKAR